MAIKAFVQKGRGKPGLVLPASAVARINESKDRSALIRAADFSQSLELTDDNSVPAIQEPADSDIDTEPDAQPFGNDALPASQEPADETPASAPKIDAPTNNGLQKITGIGPATETRLKRYGFHSCQDIAEANPDVLNEIGGVNGRGAEWVREAQRLVEAD